jgi:sugar/nucleoside kinase (ribokinase family)
VLVDVHIGPVRPARITSPAMSTAAGTEPLRTLCLGEALVDLVGEDPGRPLPEISRFSPHFGGAAANVAVVAARLGARITLAGGTGDDDWGRWLQARLERPRDTAGLRHG